MFALGIHLYPWSLLLNSWSCPTSFQLLSTDNSQQIIIRIICLVGCRNMKHALLFLYLWHVTCHCSLTKLLWFLLSIYSIIQNAKKKGQILLKPIVFINISKVDLIHWNICRQQKLGENNMDANFFKYSHEYSYEQVCIII